MWKRGSGGGGGGGGGAGGEAPPEANDIWKYQIKWNHFHHVGPEYFFFTISEAILFFFLHMKNQNIFLDKNPAPPPPTNPR